MPDLTPEFLDALEAKAKAANENDAVDGPWLSADGTVYAGDYAPEGEPDLFVEVVAAVDPAKVAAHIAANSPDVTLALIARIRTADRLYAVADDLGLEGVSDEMAAALAAYQETVK